MKVIIEDLVKKHEGNKETELPKETTIRFEIEDSECEFARIKLSCKVEDNCLKIYKCCDIDDRIMIIADNSNSIYIK